MNSIHELNSSINDVYMMNLFRESRKKICKRLLSRSKIIFIGKQVSNKSWYEDIMNAFICNCFILELKNSIFMFYFYKISISIH
jgi:hypothetical protein